jgi:hypothetical protein
MMGLNASLLKIDFNYKIAKKIRVWTKQGQSFTPFKCIVTVQNEDGLTVFWKALKHSKSIMEISPDLIRLRERLNGNLRLKKQPSKFGPHEQAVKCIYVDNCCSVCHMIRHCFPGSLIKLDCFHWIKRWTDIMSDPKSAEAGVFRALMSRALFNVDPTEFRDAKQRLKEKKQFKDQDPTTKQILRGARSVIPDPVSLRTNIEAVICYIQAKDAETETKLATRREGDMSPKPKRFLVSSATAVRDRVQQQLRHVDRGCLSDPPKRLVNVHRYNERTQCTYVARGTNTNERDNLDLATLILAATAIGK